MAEIKGSGGDDMSVAEFQIAYDGPVMSGHSMDVQELGPALLAVGDLCREASQIVNGDRVSAVNVRVKANFHENCFDITFELIEVFKKVTTFLETPEVISAKNLLDWLGLAGLSGSGGLLGYLLWKRGRPIEKIEQTTSAVGSPVYNITLKGEGNHFEISAPVYHLSQSPRVMAAQRGITSPLEVEGIDKIVVKEKGKIVNEVTKVAYESGTFGIIESEIVSEESLEPQTFRAVLVIRAPVFVEGAKWQFFLGESRITALIADPRFIQRVFVGGERFGVNDRLDVDLALTQVLTIKGTYRNDYEVVKVHDVKRGPHQLDLLHDPNRGD